MMKSSASQERPIPPALWRQVVASSLRIEWTRIEPRPALRCTLGVGVPVVIALLLGQAGAATFIAVGAVSAGFGSFQGAYRSRAATMLCAAVGMAGSLFVGSLAGHSTIAATAVAALWGLTAGLVVALGPAASFVALQSAVAVLVAGAYPSSLNEAAGRGVLVLAGGLGQIVLVVALWPLRRFQTERRVIGRVYRSLADYAGTLAQPAIVPPEPHTWAEVAPLDRDSQPFARSSELLVFRGLLDEAERIRAGLAALSLSSARQYESLSDQLSRVLREIGVAVDDGRAPARLRDEWDRLDAAAASLRQRATPIDTLLAQLRAACRMASAPAVDEPSADEPDDRPWTLPPVRAAVMTLAANLSWRSTACRHALRLGVAVAFATAVYRGAGLPRGYWFPMTTLLVLKPEFHETLVTGVARMVGTLIGAAVAVLLVRTFGLHPAVVTALLLAFVWSGYALFRASYAAFTICITGYIVLLLYLAGVPGPIAAAYRAFDTLLGGVLALTIYRLWPTWEASHVRDVLAAEVEALARDTDVLLGAYVDPEGFDVRRLQQTLSAARLARSNAEASVERMLSEPPGHDRFDGEFALSLLAAFRRYALGALALHAGLDTQPVGPTAELAPLKAQISSSLAILANALRHATDPAPLPPLRDTHVRLKAVGDPAIAEQTDALVESVTTIAHLLTSAARR